jgi:hypothetical protein
METLKEQGDIKLHYEELNNLYLSKNNFRLINLNRMKGAGYAA